jgi:hypothetical protein
MCIGPRRAGERTAKHALCMCCGLMVDIETADSARTAHVLACAHFSRRYERSRVVRDARACR